MLSPHRIPPNSHKRRQKISNDNSNRENGFKMTSNDPKRPQKIEVVKPKTTKKNKLNGGFLGEKHEINNEYLDEILHNNL